MKKWFFTSVCLIGLLGLFVAAGCDSWTAGSDNQTMGNDNQATGWSDGQTNSTQTKDKFPGNMQAGDKRIVGTVIKKDFTTVGIQKDPATLFSIKQDDGSIYYAGIKMVYSKKPIVGDRIEAFVDEERTVAFFEWVPSQRENEGYVQVIPIERWWYQIVKYKILE